MHAIKHTLIHMNVQELYDAINELDLPANFLDELINQLGGPSQVCVFVCIVRAIYPLYYIGLARTVHN